MQVYDILLQTNTSNLTNGIFSKSVKLRNVKIFGLFVCIGPDLETASANGVRWDLCGMGLYSVR